jgi:hypothetical protein
MDKLNNLPALNDISSLWKTERMGMHHHLSTAADLQCVLYRTTCHYHFPEETNQSLPIDTRMRRKEGIIQTLSPKLNSSSNYKPVSNYLHEAQSFLRR